MGARLRIITCGAIAPEVRHVCQALGIEAIVDPLPAGLHNTPERIPAAVLARIEAHPDDRIVVGYADCGTGGALDRELDRIGVERLEGAHCYELYAGPELFARLHEEEPGTFYLTDFLARNFEVLVWRGLALDRHPQLRDVYFGNYRRLVFLSQRGSDRGEAAARTAAEMLGLELEVVHTGLRPLSIAVGRAVAVGVAEEGRA